MAKSAETHNRMKPRIKGVLFIVMLKILMSVVKRMNIFVATKLYACSLFAGFSDWHP